MKKGTLFRLLAGLAASLIVAAALPVTALGLTPDLNIYSDAYVVMDAASGQVLIEKNMNKQKAPGQHHQNHDAGTGAGAVQYR